MRILLASGEVHPYSKTGGLADMAGALATALASRGHQVGLVTPLYRGIREQYSKLKRLKWELDLPLGGSRVQAQVWTLNPVRGLTIYFIEQPEFFDRSGLYQEMNMDFPDNDARFVFFSKAVTNLARHLPWQPEIVHVHDWQAGLVPLFIAHQKWREGWGKAPRTVLTIHNLAYQGNFPASGYPLTNLPWDYFQPNGAEFYGGFSCLKAGIAYADFVTTVSPRYAREITTKEFGCGLDGVLRKRQDALVGILNGVDYAEWNTTKNPCLKHSFSLQDLDGKMACKLDVQAELGLPVNAATPLFANITRLVEQKGVDILLGALEEMLAAEMQFVLLGSGSPVFEAACRELAARHPSQFAARIGYDHALSHRIEAGSDFYLMPSRFEPCGLNQMYSLRYGSIPIVRATGGLDDTITDINQDPDSANGIKFHDPSVHALAKAVRKALVLYQNPKLTRFFQFNGMSADFSWQRTTEIYLDLYAQAISRGAASGTTVLPS